MSFILEMCVLSIVYNLYLLLLLNYLYLQHYWLSHTRLMSYPCLQLYIFFVNVLNYHNNHVVFSPNWCTHVCLVKPTTSQSWDIRRWSARWNGWNIVFLYDLQSRSMTQSRSDRADVINLNYAFWTEMSDNIKKLFHNCKLKYNSIKK